MNTMQKYAILALPLLAAACNSDEQFTTTRLAEPVARIVEYTPAPGQFINERNAMSGFAGEATPEAACAYVARRFERGDFVSLGGWGGYLVAAFAEPVPATGDYELYVAGNQMPTSSEPGVIYVAQDTDGDRSPAGETWYELKGSEFAAADRSYRITYRRPAADGDPVAWTAVDGAGETHTGQIGRIGEHTQNYYPAWIAADELTFRGTRLPNNITEGEVDDQGRPVTAWIAHPFAWGYADNYSSIDRQGAANRFRIEDAVTADGAPANLSQIDFIKVQSGVNDWRSRIGELSTEVCGIGCYRTVTTAE